MRIRTSVALSIALVAGCAQTPPAATPSSTAASTAPTSQPAAQLFVAAAPPIDPASMPKQRPVLLKAARLFDGRGDRVLDGGVAILVENGLVTRVGAAASVTAPADAETIDLGDATLLPGFMDAHTHVSFEASGNYYKDDFDFRMRFPAEQAHYAASYARKLLDIGFTTIRDVGSDDSIDVGLRNAINKDLVVGPRMLVAVHSIGATGGHCDSPPVSPDRERPNGIYEGVCNGADACAAAVRTQVKYGADVIKICASGGVLSLADAVDTPQLTRAEMEAIVLEAHRLGKKVAAHCHGDTAGKFAIDAGVDSLEHGSFLKPDTLAMMKKKGTVLVPTLLASHWLSDEKRMATFPPPIQAKIRQAIAANQAMFREALRVGVVIGFGTDSAVAPHGMNAREFSLMTALGMSPAAALRAATSVDAQLLGIAAQTGTLEAGKLADVVAVPGNPLVDIKQTEHVVFVMRAGRVYKRP
jgi:imidazolonepropionase-like amidohydrolase